MNERFTRLADKISEVMGRWWMTSIALLVVLIWLVSGPLFQYSSQWNFFINDLTNIVSLLLLFIVAASANRVDRHNATMQQQSKQMLEQIHYIANKLLELMGGVEELLQHDIEVTEHDRDVTEQVDAHIQQEHNA